MNTLYVFRTASLIKSIITMYFNMSLLSVQAVEATHRDSKWPCTSRSTIEWVRHPNDCSRYFICQLGQPVLMSECPYEQVWSAKAMNCVPEFSRWNDCHPTQLSKMKDQKDGGNSSGTDEEVEKHHPFTTSTTPAVFQVSVQTIGMDVSPTAINRPTPRDSSAPELQAATIPASIGASSTTATPQGGRLHPNTTATPQGGRLHPTQHQNQTNSALPPMKERKEKKITRNQTMESPFQPISQKKYYIYLRKNKTRLIMKSKKNKTRSHLIRKETKPSMKTTNVPQDVFSTFPTSTITPSKFPTQKQKKTLSLPTTPKHWVFVPGPKQDQNPRRPQGIRKLPTFVMATRKPHTKHDFRTTKVVSKPPLLQITPSKTTRPKPTMQTTASTKTIASQRRTPPLKQKTSTITPTYTATATTTRSHGKTTPPSLETWTIPTMSIHQKTTLSRQKKSTVTTPSSQATSEHRRRSSRPRTPTVTSTQSPHTGAGSTDLMTMTTETPLEEKEETKETEDGGFGVLTTDVSSDRATTPVHRRLPPGHPCASRPGKLVGHPTQCHWYYNCSGAALKRAGGNPGEVKEECRYPQLFDSVTGHCREFINVQCQSRFEPVDPCEYQALQCQTANCVPCHNRYGACRGRPNGIYPLHSSRWTPTFVTCYRERNIAQDDCQAPTPIFSPVVRDCVSLPEVPKERGGLRPDCAYRQNGFYADEQGRCGIFFQCHNKNFVKYDECPLGTVFDPLSVHCQPLQHSTPPCGEGPAPSCSHRPDGFHADPFGRCPYYFECRGNRFVQHHTCDFGSFDPLTQECVIPAELIPRPCGLLPNPCEGRSSGFYPDESSGCRQYIECSRGILMSRATCPEGSLFSVLSRRCDRPENVPEPCGLAMSCRGKRDGRYAALAKGCSFYYVCARGRLEGLRQCKMEDGGIFFNERTRKCDFPLNICPPCGYRWWGCVRGGP